MLKITAIAETVKFGIEIDANSKEPSPPDADDMDMRALSIRQPFAELILRGLKTIEYRSRPTRILGERFYIYASKGPATRFSRSEHGIFADNLVAESAPPWMIELANALKLFDYELPTGLIVGSAVISECTPHSPPVARGDRRRTSSSGI
jgi:hypothetical protein